jgi:tRNA splicing ligase
MECKCGYDSWKKIDPNQLCMHELTHCVWHCLIVQLVIALRDATVCSTVSCHFRYVRIKIGSISNGTDATDSRFVLERAISS